MKRKSKLIIITTILILVLLQNAYAFPSTTAKKSVTTTQSQKTAPQLYDDLVKSVKQFSVKEILEIAYIKKYSQANIQKTYQQHGYRLINVDGKESSLFLDPKIGSTSIFNFNSKGNVYEYHDEIHLLMNDSYSTDEYDTALMACLKELAQLTNIQFNDYMIDREDNDEKFITYISFEIGNNINGTISGYRSVGTGMPTICISFYFEDEFEEANG